MKTVLILAFQFLTAPVSAHMISRVQHPTVKGETVIDELSGEPTAGMGEETVEDTVVREDESDSSEETTL
ncbi:MAG: monovalent cation/H(+) antiporter subunit G [bacterium]